MKKSIRSQRFVAFGLAFGAIFLIGAIVCMLSAPELLADGGPQVIKLGAQPVRVVENQLYVMDVPPSETGIVATLVLSSDSSRWDAPVFIDDNLVTVPPGVAYGFDYSGVPGESSVVSVRRGYYPWSGGEEAYVWASAYYSQSKAVVKRSVREQSSFGRIFTR
jgi:hypothetical protein